MKRRALISGLAASTTWVACKPGCRPTTRDDVGGVVVDDSSGLNETRVRRVVSCRSVEEVSAAVVDAAARGFKVIASGRRLSQGGQSCVDDGVIIDLTPMKRVLDVDDNAGTVTVEAGATVDDVVQALRARTPRRALRVTPALHNPTIGGALAADVHTPSGLTMASSVVSLTLVDARGAVQVVKPGDDLFGFVVSGFGLFGVVVAATLQTVPDEPLQHHADVVATDALAGLLARPAALRITRLSTAPSTLLAEALVESWSVDATGVAVDDVVVDDTSARERLLLDAARASVGGKENRWLLQKDRAQHAPLTVARSAALRALPVLWTPVPEASHEGDGVVVDIDFLFDAVVAADAAAGFIADAKKVVLRERTNLLDLIVQSIAASSLAHLTIAPVDSLSFLFHVSLPGSAQGRAAGLRLSERLGEAVLAHGGRHHLTFSTSMTPQQTARAWPQLAAFFAKKKELDKDLVFRSRFFDAYSFL